MDNRTMGQGRFAQRCDSPEAAREFASRSKSIHFGQAPHRSDDFALGLFFGLGISSIKTAIAVQATP